MGRITRRFALLLVGTLAAAALAPAVSSAGVEELSTCNRLDRLEVRPGGEVVAVGQTYDCLNPDTPRKVVAVQLDASGQLDSTFGNGGIVVLAQTLTKGIVPDLEIQSSGRTVINTGQALVGLTSSGTADPSFGTGGVARLDYGIAPAPYLTTARSFALNSANQILVSGSLQPTRNDEDRLVLARYTANGALDEDFGDSGLVEPESWPGVIEVGPGGKIYGASTTFVPPDFASVPSVTRFNPDGSIDETYGPNLNGTATTDPAGFAPSSITVTSRIALSPTGAATISGSSLTSGFNSFALRLTPEGLPSPGNPRRPVTAVSAGGNSLTVSGPDLPEIIQQNGNFDFSLLDPADTAIGAASIQFGYYPSMAEDAQFGPDGSAYAAGWVDTTTCNGDHCNKAMMIAKLGSSAAGLDPAFGNDPGVATIPRIPCRVWGLNPLGESSCHDVHTTFPTSARITFGKSRKPGVIFKASLPAPKPVGKGSMERTLTVKLPGALKLTGRRPKVTATFNGIPIAANRANYIEGSIKLNLRDSDWSFPNRNVTVRVQRGSLKPLSRKQRFKRLEFASAFFYKYSDGSDSSGTTSVKSQPVQKAKKPRK